MISPLPKPKPKRMKLGPMSFFKEGGEGRFLKEDMYLVYLKIMMI